MALLLLASLFASTTAAAVAGSGTTVVPWRSGYEYVYQYTAESRIHEAETLTTSAKVIVYPFDQSGSGGGVGGSGYDASDRSASGSGGRLCRMEVLSFEQRSHRAGQAGMDVVVDAGYDFSRWFGFSVGPHGDLVSVTHARGDYGEVLRFKRAFAGLLSARLHLPDASDAETWDYRTNDELDHGGAHTANYSVVRAVDGTSTFYTKTLTPVEADHLVRNHTKRIVLDHKQGGAIAHAVQDDDVIAGSGIMAASTGGIDSPTSNGGRGGGGSSREGQHHPFEMPDMRASGTAEIRLETWVLSRAKPLPAPEDAVTATPAAEHTSVPAPSLASLDEARSIVLETLDCMADPMRAREHTPCFKNLTETLRRCSTTTLGALATEYLGPLVREAAASTVATRWQPKSGDVIVGDNASFSSAVFDSTLNEQESSSADWNWAESARAGSEQWRAETLVDALGGVYSASAQELLVSRAVMQPVGGPRLQHGARGDDGMARRVLLGLAHAYQQDNCVPAASVVSQIEQLAQLHIPVPDDLVAGHTEAVDVSLPSHLHSRAVREQSTLLLGIAADRLRGAGQLKAATAIVDKLEKYLGAHDSAATRAETQKVRERRDAAHMRLAELGPAHPDFAAAAHDAYRPHAAEARRALLLEAVGNAAHPQSVSLLAGHLLSNATNPELRRAGVSALRHFNCTASAHALLEAAVLDPWQDVRDAATDHYSRHPLRMSMQQLNATLMSAALLHSGPGADVGFGPGSSTANTQGAGGNHPLVRLRRGVNTQKFMDFLKRLSFKLEIPPVDWNKKIGSDKLGVDMGIKLENRLLLQIDDLAGKAEVVVDNRAWITVLLGVLKKNFDVLRAEACYKGGVGYDLNFLKDFGIDNIFDIVFKFDRLVKGIVGKVKDGFNAFRDRMDEAIQLVGNGIKSALNGGIKDLFSELAAQVKDLPNRFGSGGGLISHLLQKLNAYSSIPSVRRIARVIRRVRNLYDSVVGDVMMFHRGVVEGVTVDLPWAAGQIWDSVKRVWSALENLFKTPIKSVGEIAAGVFRAKAGIKTILQVKKRIVDALFKRNGGTFFVRIKNRMKGFLSDIRDVWEALKGLFADAQKREISAADSGCQDLLNVATQRRIIFQDLKDTVSGILSPLESFQQLIEPFLGAWNKVQGAIKLVKDGFWKLRSGFEKAQSFFLKVFGPRFHEDFPKQIRGCSQQCDCGVYPAEKGGGDHWLPGIDLDLGEGETVPAPFEGTAYYLEGLNTVVIEPKNALLRRRKVIINNVEPDASLTMIGSYVSAGAAIGVAARSKCQPNYIHVAVIKRKLDSVAAAADEGALEVADKRRTLKDALNDLTAGLFQKGDGMVDPTPFTKKKGFPVPKWVQVCDSYSLVLVGKTIGKGTISEAVKKLAQSIKKIAKQALGKGPKDDSAASEGGGDGSSPSTTPEPEKPPLKDRLKAKFSSEAEKYKQMANEKIKEAKETYEIIPVDPNIYEKMAGAKLTPLGADDELQAKKFSFQFVGGTTNGPLNGFCIGCISVNEMRTLMRDGVKVLPSSGTDGGGGEGEGEEKNGQGDLATTKAASTTVAAADGKNATAANAEAEAEATSCLDSAVDALVKRLEPKGQCLHPFFLSDWHLRRRLQLLGLDTSGAHEELVERLSHPPPAAMCTTGSNGIVASTMSSCSVDRDCLGITCCVRVRQIFFEDVVGLSVRVDPCTSTMTLSLGSVPRTFDISKDGEEQYRAETDAAKASNTTAVAGALEGGSCTMRVYTDVRWSTRDRSGENGNIRSLFVDITARLCHAATLQCVGGTRVLDRHEFVLHDTHCDGNKGGGGGDNQTPETVRERINRGSMDDLLLELQQNDIYPPRCLRDEIADVRDALILSFAEDVEASLSWDGEGEFPAEAFDICIPGTIQFPTKQVVFFQPPGITVMVGPIPLTFRFSAGGAYGMSITLRFCILSMKVEVILTPWAGVDVMGEVEVSLIAVHAGLRLTGQLLKTKMPLTAATSFKKMPLKVNVRMDMEMVPLGFVLQGYAQVGIKVFGIRLYKTVFKGTIWSWSMDAINMNIFDTTKPDEDKTPPAFGPVGVDKESVPAGLAAANAPSTGKCSVEQIPDRDPRDPAFKLQYFVADDKSDVKATYSVGTTPDGTDVVDAEDMGGMVLVKPAPEFPSGKPLYFTVEASNSGGGVGTAKCSIVGWDTTLPTGRFVADHEFSSNPTVLSGTLIGQEDSELLPTVEEGVGSGRGPFAGDSVKPWSVYNLVTMEKQAINASHGGLNASLAEFSLRRDGELFAPVIKSANFGERGHPGKCANLCLAENACLSFDFDWLTGDCRLHDLYAVTKEDLHVHPDDQWHHYERLVYGHGAVFSHKNLGMKHNSLNFMTAKLKNPLGYTSYISSQGTRIDLLCPVTPPLKDVTRDEVLAHGCNAAPTMTCEAITPAPNHRMVVDGYGGEAIWNGLERGTELRYTRDAHLAAVTWNHFVDEESGMKNYVWGLGTQPCMDDIWQWVDPHAEHHSVDDWELQGLAYPLGDNVTGLPEGKYYASVSGLNAIVHGGSLVTTLCHGVPYAVDRTPPIIRRVYDFHFVDADRVQARYDAYDNVSDIASVGLALGRTRYDTAHMSFVKQDWHPRQVIRVHLADNAFDVEDGDLLWAVLEAWNGVGLSAVGVADEPVLVDFSPPIAGVVNDGDELHQDLRYTKSSDTLCVNWDHFNDPESHILQYDLTLSPTPTKAPAKTTFGPIMRHGCVKGLVLEHNTKYAARITAYNHGHLRLSAHADSDGVLVDLTAPNTKNAVVMDGKPGKLAPKCMPSAANVAAFWRGFFDKESGVTHYEVEVESNVRGTLMSRHNYGNATAVDMHHFHLQHGEKVKSLVYATNGATATSQAVASQGVGIDLTAPVAGAVTIGPSRQSNQLFQATSGDPQVFFGFSDPESGIESIHVRLVVVYGGQRRYFPGEPKALAKDSTSYTAVGASVAQGALYHFELTAENSCGKVTRVLSPEAILDTTPPVVSRIVVGNMDGEDEVIDPVTKAVETAQRDGVEAWWAGNDPESGVASYTVSLGTTRGGADLLAKKDLGLKTRALLELAKALDVGTTVYLTVTARNRGGAEGSATSHPLKIVAADRPGHVRDGWPRDADIDAQAQDHTITATFEGFYSNVGIARYEYAVGTQPGGSDVQSFTTSGLLMSNDGTKGVVHAPLPLRNERTYHVSVRAITAAGAALESTSSGVLVDTSPPDVIVEPWASANELGVATALPLSARWKVTDSGAALTPKRTWRVGSYPGGDDLHPRTETTGDAPAGALLAQGACKDADCGKLPLYVTISAGNVIGLTAEATGPALSVDTTAPELGELVCPDEVAATKDAATGVTMTCSWSGAAETGSLLEADSVTVQLESGPDEDNLKASGSRYKLYDSEYATFNMRLGGLSDSIGAYRVRLWAKNAAGLEGEAVSNIVMVARDAPTAGTVTVIADAVNLDNAAKNYTSEALACQRSTTGVSVSWKNFGPGVVRYEVALGTAPGGAQLRFFEKAGGAAVTHFHFTGLVLDQGETVYATVRGFTAAGLTAIAVSKAMAVADGPVSGVNLPVRDDKAHISLAESREGISLRWQQRACEAARIEVALLRADGTVARDYEVVDGAFDGVIEARPLAGEWVPHTVYNLDLEAATRYHWVVRVKNRFGGVEVGRSEGFTVWPAAPPQPGDVVDGLNVQSDRGYQSSLTELSVSWTEFGGQSADGLSDAYHAISHYAVAVGTGLLSFSERTSVSKFVRVANEDARSFTINDLLLTAGTRYFVTVRATAVSGLTVSASTNGVVPGFNDTALAAGTVNVVPFQTSLTSLEAGWSGFRTLLEFEYEWAIVGTGFSRPDVGTDCVGSAGAVVKNFQKVGSETIALASSLTLSPGVPYFVAVRGHTEAGDCVQALSVKPTVADNTPPTAGVLSIAKGSPDVINGDNDSGGGDRRRRRNVDADDAAWQAYNGESTLAAASGPDAASAVYMQAPHSIAIKWTGFKDSESGMDDVEVTLSSARTCTEGDATNFTAVAGPFSANYEDGIAHFTGIEWALDAPYRVTVVARNRAGLKKEVKSSVLLIDNSAGAAAGRVFDGLILNKDRSFQSSPTAIDGIFTLTHRASDVECNNDAVGLRAPASGWSTFTVIDEGSGVSVYENADSGGGQRRRRESDGANATLTIAPNSNENRPSNSSNMTLPPQGSKNATNASTSVLSNFTAATTNNTNTTSTMVMTTPTTTTRERTVVYSPDGLEIFATRSRQRRSVKSQLLVGPEATAGLAEGGGTFSLTLQTSGDSMSVASFGIAALDREQLNGRVISLLRVQSTVTELSQPDFDSLQGINVSSLARGDAADLSDTPDLEIVPAPAAEGPEDVDPIDGEDFAAISGVVGDDGFRDSGYGAAAEHVDAIGLSIDSEPSVDIDGTFRFTATFWARFGSSERLPVRQVVTLPADPSAEPLRYALRVYRADMGSLTDWNAELLVNGEPIAELLGVPAFSGELVRKNAPAGRFFAAQWNREAALGRFPGVRPGTDPSSSLLIRDVELPRGPQAQTCGAGASFYSAHSPFVAMRAAATEQPLNATALSATWTSLPTPCQPCITACDRYTCDPDCSPEQDTERVSLTGLNLLQKQREAAWTKYLRQPKQDALTATDFVLLGQRLDGADPELYFAALVDLSAGRKLGLSSRSWDDMHGFAHLVPAPPPPPRANATGSDSGNSTTTTPLLCRTPGSTNTTQNSSTLCTTNTTSTTATTATTTTTTTTTTTAPPVRELKPGTSIDISAVFTDGIKAGTIFKVKVGALTRTDENNKTAAHLVLFEGPAENELAVKVPLLSVALRQGRANGAILADAPPRLVTSMLPNASNYAWPATTMAYTRGPHVGTRSALARDSVNVRNWQVSSLGFDALDDMPDNLKVIDESALEASAGPYKPPNQAFLRIEALTASGQVVSAVSDGVVVDDTPPHKLFAQYIVPGGSPARPTKHQANLTVLAYSFRYLDEESGVSEARVSVGTSAGGHDLEKARPLSANELKDGLVMVGGLSLEDGKRYFLALTICNRANLCTSAGEEGIIVATEASDFSGLLAQENDGESTEVALPNSSLPLLTTTSNEFASISWQGMAGDIDSVYWSLGTEPGLSNILKPVFVGPGPTFKGTRGWAEIRNGYLYVGEATTARNDASNLGNMLDIAQFGQSEQQDPTLVAPLMRLEPGLCVYHRLTAYTDALVSNYYDAVVCVLADGTVIITPSKEGELSFSVDESGRMDFEGQQANADAADDGADDGGDRRRRRRDVSNNTTDTLTNISSTIIATTTTTTTPASKITCRVKMENVGKDVVLFAGPLNGELLHSRYAGAGSTTRQVYVVDPEITTHLITRALVAREVNFLPLDFYMSLYRHNSGVNGALDLRKASLAAPLPINTSMLSSQVPSGQVPALVFWDTEAAAWRLVRDTCGIEGTQTKSADGQRLLMSDYLCATHGSKSPLYGQKAGNTSFTEFFGANTMFAAVTLNPNFVNTPPSIVTRSLEVSEGETLHAALSIADDEGDVATVAIVSPPSKGNATIEVGPDGRFVLVFVPECDRCRPYEVTLSVVVTETLQHEGRPLSSAPTSITVRVWPADRPPVVFMRAGMSTTWLARSSPNNEVRVFLQPSASGVYTLPTIVALDASPVEIFATPPQNGNLTQATGSAAVNASQAAALREARLSINVRDFVNEPSVFSMSARVGDQFVPTGDEPGPVYVEYLAMDANYLYSDPVRVRFDIGTCYFASTGTNCITAGTGLSGVCEARVCVPDKVAVSETGDGTSGSGEVSLGVIIGAAAGGAVILIVIIVLLVVRRRRQGPAAVRRAMAAGGGEAAVKGKKKMGKKQSGDPQAVFSQNFTFGFDTTRGFFDVSGGVEGAQEEEAVMAETSLSGGQQDALRVSSMDHAHNHDAGSSSGKKTRISSSTNNNDSSAAATTVSVQDLIAPAYQSKMLSSAGGGPAEDAHANLKRIRESSKKGNKNEGRRVSAADEILGARNRTSLKLNPVYSDAPAEVSTDYEVPETLSSASGGKTWGAGLLRRSKKKKSDDAEGALDLAELSTDYGQHSEGYLDVNDKPEWAKLSLRKTSLRGIETNQTYAQRPSGTTADEEEFGFGPSLLKRTGSRIYETNLDEEEQDGYLNVAGPAEEDEPETLPRGSALWRKFGYQG